MGNQASSDAAEVSTNIEPKRPWQGILLAWLSLAAMLIVFLIVVLAIIFGYAGFAGGEMGTMIGIFAAVGLIFLIPLLITIIVVTIGLFKRKRWSVVLALVITCFGILGGFFTLRAGFSFYLVVMFYLGLMSYAEIICLKHPYFHRRRAG
ncbi:MAG: hypothetical protein JRJ77_03380 [Deltaproteobacteria bacterium]|nr:hypothetical protein [Deltaproteobacteria bacterium]